ncbi:hypothetical protein T08_10751 [Trichinella sp. T8]|nr:hypothetical protein T08_3084 [Trichinella sp. T8]KRZ84304.1 hypothetical protein T08_10751 [Trichinella sp. T8]
MALSYKSYELCSLCLISHVFMAGGTFWEIGSSRKKLTSGKARTSHRDASRQKKLKGRKSKSPRSRSQLNSRHRSRSRSPSRSNSATRRL